MELRHRTAKINRNSNVCRQMAYKNERDDVVDVGVSVSRIISRFCIIISD